jgi:DNA-binding NtrC family response regulator
LPYGNNQRSSGSAPDYPWPGNIRQLENAMVYAAIMAQGRKIQVKGLPKEKTTKSEITD